MFGNDIIGNQRSLAVLQRALRTGRMAHASLFTGPEGCVMEPVALELAAILNCQLGSAALTRGSCGSCPDCLAVKAFMHQNVEYLFPIESTLLDTADGARRDNRKAQEARERYDALIEEKKQNRYLMPAMERSMGILTEQILALQHKALFMPSAGNYKLFIISQADRMLPAAANKLLKLLEEPPAHVRFILLSARPDTLLPTIRSRCQQFKFSRPEPHELDQWLQANHPAMDEAERRFTIAFSRGNLRLFHDMVSSRNGSGGGAQDITQLRDQAISYLRDLLTPAGFVKALLTAEQNARSMNRQELTLFLSALLLFMQDGCRRRIMPGFEPLNNPDIADSIDRFAGNFGTSDFLHISMLTEETIRTIARNGNPLLAMASYTAWLRGLLKKG